MNKIEIGILQESSMNPAGMMMFLAKLTQRGHKIKNISDLQNLFNNTMLETDDSKRRIIEAVANLPHGTIKRFSPITIAIVGASRRFLTQIRTHSIGVDFVSASLQYSDYSGQADFVIPYELLEADVFVRQAYIDKCKNDLAYYEKMIEQGLSNDTAGYSMNQALRNILIIQGNHEAWLELIRKRSCHRNTEETAYVVTRIWELLYGHSGNGDMLFKYAGPDCLHGKCREGKMCCEQGSFVQYIDSYSSIYNPATMIIKKRWPLCQ